MAEVVFFHRASCSILVADLVQKFDPASVRGWRGAVMKWKGIVGPDGGTPFEYRLSFWNRRAARTALDRMLAWNPHHLIIAHGEWVRENGGRATARSLRWLGGAVVER